jgi:hypothetical protein
MGVKYMKKRLDVTKKFKVALAIAGITQYEFSGKVGVTAAAVSQVIRGLWSGGMLHNAVLAFIDEHVPSNLQAQLDREDKIL